MLVFDQIATALESGVNEGIVSARWEIGQTLFDQAASIGLIKQTREGQLILFRVPVTVLTDEPETLRLIGEKVNVKE